MAARPHSYLKAQIALHWLVAALVVAQFISSAGIEAAWRAWRSTGTAEPSIAAQMHVWMGIIIFVLALWRIALRFAHGAPPLPDSDPAPLRLLARVTHFALYALILLVPLSGFGAWFGGAEQAAAGHRLTKNLLFFVVLLHVTGALVQHFWFRTDVLRRMLSARP